MSDTNVESKKIVSFEKNQYNKKEQLLHQIMNSILKQFEYDYEFINLGINEALFDGSFADLPLYLDFEGDLLARVSSNLQCSEQDFIELLGSAVSNTLLWRKNNIYAFHEEKFRAWIANDANSPPPFTALLASLSCAAEQMSADGNFSASNYYQRLFQHFGTPEAGSATKLGAAGKYTEQFWQSLNHWLVRTNNAYGVPTARVVNSWRYVSYAISQALIREGDRQRLGLMFSEFGISPKEKVSETEMSLYLDEWMSRSSATSWLQKVWSTPDLRDRVVAAALEELSVWEGGSSNGEHLALAKQLFWSAQIKNFPKKSLRMFLGVSGRREDYCCEFGLAGDSTALVNETFQETEGSVWFSEYAGFDYFVLDPIRKISIDHLMLASFTLKAKASRLQVMRAHKPIIVLAKQEDSPLFREVSRVSLNQKCMVLCHENWTSKVKDHIDAFCQVDFKQYEKGDIQGLPFSWTLFSDVCFTSTVGEDYDPNQADQLSALIPLGDGEGVHLDGGLKLAANVWHRDFLPTCYANDKDGLISCELFSRSLDGLGDVLARQSEPTDIDFLYDPIRESESTHFLVKAMRSNKAISRDLAIRTADYPKRIAEPPLRREIKAGLVSSENIGPNESEEFCEGFYLSAEVLPAENYGTLSPPSVIRGLDVDEDPLSDVDYLGAIADGSQELCALRGYHIWLLEPYDGKKPLSAPIKMTCSGCNVSMISRNRSKKGRKKTVKAAVKSLPISFASRPVNSFKNQAVSESALFDALCYQGVGSRSRLEQVLSNGDVDIGTMLNRVRNLEDLGHIEIMTDEDSLIPIKWAVTTPTLVETSGGDLFLSGFRSEKFLAELKSAVHKQGYFLQSSVNVHAPDTIKILGDGLQNDVRDLIESVEDAHGRRVRFAPKASEMLCNILPSASAKFLRLREVAAPAENDVEFFDLGKLSWTPVNIISQSGAYRRKYLGTKYFFIDEERRVWLGSPGNVKLLAAKSAGIFLHGYDEVSRTFFSLLGAEPPAIYRRALVACSGEPPVKKNGLLCFADVPKSIAVSLFNKLYGE